MAKTLQANQIAAAFSTVPSRVVTMLDHAFTGTRTSTADTFETMSSGNADEASGSFNIAFAGVYRIALSVASYNSSGDGTNEYQITFDKGTADEQSVRSDNWNLGYSSAGTQVLRGKFNVEVELTAGQHTVDVEWRRRSGNTHTMAASTANTLKVDGMLLSGSGVGGTIVDQKSPAAFVVSNTSPTKISGSEFVVNVQEGETVWAIAEGYGRSEGASPSKMDLAVYVDDVSTGHKIEQYSESGQAKRSMNMTAPITGLSAGQHTISFYAWYISGNEQWKYWDPVFSVLQFRGGQVPLQKDGTEIAATPRYLNFIGSHVDISDDGLGGVDVGLTDAVAGPDDSEEIVHAIGSEVVLDTTATYEEMFPSDTTKSYTPKVTGRHRVEYQFVARINRTGAESDNFKFKVEFDDGVNSPLVVGDDATWFWRMYNTDTNAIYRVFKFEGFVDLVAGTTYDVKGYGQREGSSSSCTLTIAGVTFAQKVTIMPLSGSGAGGTLGQTTEVTDYVVTSLDPTYEEVLAQTIEIAENDVLHVSLSAVSVTKNSGNTRTRTKIFVDETLYYSYVPFITDTYRPVNLSTTFYLRGLSPGPHTVKLMCAKDSGGPDWELQGATKLSTSIHRGGLVPVRSDGVEVLDKPAAWDFSGDFQVTNVGGTAAIASKVQSRGVDVSDAAELSASFSNSSTSTWEDIDNGGGDALTLTVEGNPGEWVMLFADANLSNSSSGTHVVLQWLIDGAAHGNNMFGDIEHTGGAGNAVLSLRQVEFFQLTSASHTVKLQMQTFTDTATVINAGSSIRYVRFKSGSIQPENIPILDPDNFSGDTFKFMADYGASSQGLITFNDGKQYKITLPYSMDLATTGLGGMETSATLANGNLYNYAVPDTANPGWCGIICSDQAPSSGPADYDTWAYLGPLTRKSGALHPMVQTGARFEYKYTIGSIIDLGAGAQARANHSLAPDLPASAKFALCRTNLASSTESGHYAKIYVKNETADWTFLAYAHQPNPLLEKFWVYSPDQTIDYESVGASLTANRVQVAGFIDAYLAGRMPTQAQVTNKADTKSPKGTWATTSTVSFAARPGQPSTVRKTGSDNKQRYMTTGTFDIANGVADWGYDEAGSQGNSKWLYFYLVPKSGDDTQWVVRASDNDPSTGPAGYSAWIHVWTTYIDGSGNLLEVLQSGNRLQWAEAQIDSTLSVQAQTGYDASSYCPATASIIMLTAGVDYGSAQATLTLYPAGATNQYASCTATSGKTPDTVRAEMPVGGSPRGFDYALSGTGGTGDFYFTGWIDESIEA